MPKAITEVYFELSITNSYPQISCSFHSNIVKIISILIHHIANTVFVCKFSRVNQNVLVSYMSHKLRTKIMAQLNFVQRLHITNQKGYSNFDTKCGRYDFYQSNIWQMSHKTLFWMSVVDFLAWSFELKTASQIFLIFFNEFLSNVKNTFLQDSSRRLLLIFRKPDIQIFHSKWICSLDQYCRHAIFDV